MVSIHAHYICQYTVHIVILGYHYTVFPLNSKYTNIMQHLAYRYKKKPCLLKVEFRVTVEPVGHLDDEEKLEHEGHLGMAGWVICP